MKHLHYLQVTESAEIAETDWMETIQDKTYSVLTLTHLLEARGK